MMEEFRNYIGRKIFLELNPESSMIGKALGASYCSTRGYITKVSEEYMILSRHNPKIRTIRTGLNQDKKIYYEDIIDYELLL